VLDKLAAAAIIALGAFFVASSAVTSLNRTWHIDALMQRAGRGGPLASLFAVVGRHFRVVIATGGIVLIAMGVLVWSGELFLLNIKAQQALNGLGIDFFNGV
jgi:hypothetical protein